jgi:hypothetical protein
VGGVQEGRGAGKQEGEINVATAGHEPAVTTGMKIGPSVPSVRVKAILFIGLQSVRG